MFKFLLDKKKREALKEPIEVAFAVLTIISFIDSRRKKRQESDEETEQCQQKCPAAS